MGAGTAVAAGGGAGPGLRRQHPPERVLAQGQQPASIRGGLQRRRGSGRERGGGTERFGGSESGERLGEAGSQGHRTAAATPTGALNSTEGGVGSPLGPRGGGELTRGSAPSRAPGRGLRGQVPSAQGVPSLPGLLGEGMAAAGGRLSSAASRCPRLQAGMQVPNP